MASVAPITQNEILEALEIAYAGTSPAHALTVADMVAKTGIGRRKTEERLLLLKAEGRLLAYRVKRERLDGVMRSVPAYVITPKPKARK